MSEICWHVDMSTCRHCLTSLPKGVAKLTNKKWLKMTLRKLICDTEHSPVIIFNDTYHHRYHVLRGLSWPWHYVSHTFWKSGLTFNTQTKTWLERKTIQKYHISHPAYPRVATGISIDREKTNILNLHHEQDWKRKTNRSTIVRVHVMPSQ